MRHDPGHLLTYTNIDMDTHRYTHIRLFIVHLPQGLEEVLILKGMYLYEISTFKCSFEVFIFIKHVKEIELNKSVKCH